MAIIVGKPINGISINGNEYMWDDKDELLIFKNENEARNYMYERGIRDEDIENYGVVFEELDEETREWAARRNERISISFFDLHCLARLLQSAMTQHGDAYKGCKYCTYKCFKRNNDGEYTALSENADFVMGQLYRMTGVGLSPYRPTMQDLEHEKSPCLDNRDFSSKEAKERFFSQSTGARAEH